MEIVGAIVVFTFAVLFGVFLLRVRRDRRK